MAENSKGGILNKTEKFLRRRKTKVITALINSIIRFYFSVLTDFRNKGGCLAVVEKLSVNKIAGV